MSSIAVDRILSVLKLYKVPVVTEYKFHPTRKWRFDIAIPAHLIAIEYEGGVFTGGRHTSSMGFVKDVEKYNEAVLNGWRLLRVTANDMHKKNYEFVLYEQIKRLIND